MSTKTITHHDRVETEISTERWNEMTKKWHQYCIWKLREEGELHAPSVDQARRQHDDMVRREASQRLRFVVVDHEITERIVTKIEEDE